MRIFLWSLSLPLLVASLALELFMPKKVRSDLIQCMLVVNKRDRIPSSFVEALIIAEDHRSYYHPGVDPVAILIMVFNRLRYGRSRGASTIEQQYVRVVTNRYERTGLRKLREQMIAIMIARRASKSSIASAYLTIAFYGTDFVGVGGLRARFGEDLESVSFYQALEMVAQLKYPRPRNPTDEWHSKISARLAVILRRIDNGFYNAPNTTFDPVRMVPPRHK